MNEHSGILVIGAGAVGGLTAALIRQRGLDVTLVCRDPRLARKISSKGIHLFGHCGDRRIRIPAVAGVNEVSGPVDTILIATKAHQAEQVAREVLPLLKTTSRVVSMQNGIVEEELSRIVGMDRIVGCVVRFGATLHEPGFVEMTSGGEILLGYLDRPADSTLSEIARILSFVVPTGTTDRIMSVLYSKLIINSCISTLGAVSGLNLGSLLKLKKARLLFLTITAEAMRVAGAMGLEVAPLAGRFTYQSLLNQRPLSRQLLIRIYGHKYKNLRSSNLRSLERGRKTEIDFLNGYIVQKGRLHGVDTPVNSRLVRMVHEIENKIRPITPLNLEDELLDPHL